MLDTVTKTTTILNVRAARPQRESRGLLSLHDNFPLLSLRRRVFAVFHLVHRFQTNMLTQIDKRAIVELIS